MVRHIVLWQFTDAVRAGGKAQTIALLREKFAAMAGVVPGLLTVEIGEDYSGGGYDIALYCEFESRSAQAAYQDHPLHVQLKELARDWVCGRAAIDYEID